MRIRNAAYNKDTGVFDRSLALIAETPEDGAAVVSRRVSSGAGSGCGADRGCFAAPVPFAVTWARARPARGAGGHGLRCGHMRALFRLLTHWSMTAEADKGAASAGGQECLGGLVSYGASRQDSSAYKT